MKPRISHTACHGGLRSDTDTARIMRAENSRMNEFISDKSVNWRFSWGAKRNGLSVGDGEPVPFVRDLLLYPPGTDIIFLTNADIGFARGIMEAIRILVLNHGAVHMKRMELDVAPVEPTPAPEILSKMGTEYIGMDGCAFTVKWWEQHQAEFPDLLMGRYGWDCIMRNLIRRHGGVELRHHLWHERHTSPWLNNGDWMALPGNLYNLSLVDRWIERHGGDRQDHTLTDSQLLSTFKP